jgi:adenylosuccinate lyase
MEAWKRKTPFLDLLLADDAVTTQIEAAALRDLFDYTFYTQNVHATFERLGL